MHMKMYKKSKGFSLIEVLVTLVLIAVGVLGMVALQAKGISFTKDAGNRNTAVTLADDLVELMRTYPDELFEKMPPRFPMYTGLKQGSVFYKNKNENFALGACDLNAKAAKSQLACWLEQAEEQLPGASELANEYFSICQSSEPGKCDSKGSAIEIQLAWETKEGGCMQAVDGNGNGTICTYSVRVEL